MDTSNAAYQDLSANELITHALNNNEVTLAANRAIVAYTGKRTGRSPHDRYIVRDEQTQNTVAWGEVNQPIEHEVFDRLWDKASRYLKDKTPYVSHLRVGADIENFLPVRVITETAWHNLFANYLFIRPEGDYSGGKTPWTILSVPNCHTDPTTDQVNSDGVVILNISQRKVLIMGIAYAGEMKKAMFTVMNYFMPEHNVLPMHCSANQGDDGDVTIFFGLSGTGKTTLSSDPARFIIGDDEHGWSSKGVFNFEGGCYAKCIDLSKTNEPVIYKAVANGAIMENVVLNKDTLEPDFKDGSLTQNTRAAYPREHIEKRVQANQGGEPNAVIFLTCDLFGVLPPVSLLTKEQAAYYFLSGYTAKVGGTEVGVKGVEAAFSVCFGAPFFPRPAEVYGKLLMKRIEESNAKVYLVNTGWSGGAYGEEGERFAIPVTRAVVHAIQSGDILNSALETFTGFGFKIPTHLAGVEDTLLNPENTWQDKAAFKEKRQHLMKLFSDNIKKFNLPKTIVEAGPHGI